MTNKHDTEVDHPTRSDVPKFRNADPLTTVIAFARAVMVEGATRVAPISVDIASGAGGLLGVVVASDPKCSAAFPDAWPVCVGSGVAQQGGGHGVQGVWGVSFTQRDSQHGYYRGSSADRDGRAQDLPGPHEPPGPTGDEVRCTHTHTYAGGAA